MPLAQARSPAGDDRWHRNQGTDKMEGMCRDRGQVRPWALDRREVAPDTGRGRAWQGVSDSGGCCDGVKSPP